MKGVARWALARLFSSRTFEHLTWKLVGQSGTRWDDVVSEIEHPTVPYDGVGTGEELPTRLRADIVFVTARFRSGSTMFWNMLRHDGRFTAYYEPFNERGWFRDAVARGSAIDPTHFGVSDYWTEYEGLTELSELFSPDWAFRNVLLGPNAVAWEMQRFIEILVERASRRPVLQFNRADFRLPWLKARFPKAKILHIYRHPRDQWISTISSHLQGNSNAMHSLTIERFRDMDGYYLLDWAKDLSRFFPFLLLDDAEHPYALFYQMWKLSFAFGKSFADLSISYEDLCADVDGHMADVFHLLEMKPSELGQYVQKPSSRRWEAYASSDWFRDMEHKVDMHDRARWPSDSWRRPTETSPNAPA